MLRYKVFVFGSNLAGIHGAGSAKEAYNKHGAIPGLGFGRQGNSYAIPTKDKRINTLSLDEIKPYVDVFLSYAEAHPETDFDIVDIGCGLAGYTPEQIAPLFKDAPDNCKFIGKLFLYVRTTDTQSTAE